MNGRKSSLWLLMLAVVAWLSAFPACKAQFEPLPDDDSADDDDDDTADDDTGDDDTVDSLFESGPLELVDGGVYTIFLIGSMTGTPPVGSWLVEDLGTVVNADQPALRFVHAAASEGPTDWYVDGVIPDASLAGMLPGAIYPPQEQIGYFNPGDPGTYKVDVFAPGSVYGIDTPIAGDYIEFDNPDTFYSVILTGGPANRSLVRTVDDVSAPQPGNARVRLFHSIEGLAIFDASIELVATGNSLDLWDDVMLSTDADPWEVPAGTVILRIFEAI
ncbi:MAG: hypothetical protein QGH45_15665 [Myxococcota bacterium]|jgi:hypothetical protein|nr:hypothetical protein [Myxococcota bacterium]